MLFHFYARALLSTSRFNGEKGLRVIKQKSNLFSLDLNGITQNLFSDSRLQLADITSVGDVLVLIPALQQLVFLFFPDFSKGKKQQRINRFLFFFFHYDLLK